MHAGGWIIATTPGRKLPDRVVRPLEFLDEIQRELLEALRANYGRLDKDWRAELPLERNWTIAAQEVE